MDSNCSHNVGYRLLFCNVCRCETSHENAGKGKWLCSHCTESANRSADAIARANREYAARSADSSECSTKLATDAARAEQLFSFKLQDSISAAIKVIVVMIDADKLANLSTPAWTPMRYHALQSKLWRTIARFPLVVAGRGSGKTEIYRRKCVRWLPLRKPWSDPIYCFCLPTYAQAKRNGWEKIIPLIPPQWIKGKPNKSELCVRTVFGSTLYVVGMDKPYRVEGMQIDGAVLDESSDQRPEAYTKTILPMLTHRRGWCARIGVPKRNGVGAKEFKADFEKGLLPNDIGLESYTWPSSTVLTPDQLRDEMAQLTAKDAEEQFGGVWVDAEGQIFYGYSDIFNVDASCVYNPDVRIGVGSDFNVTPMAWVMFHYQNGVMKVFDEIWLRDTNTAAALDELYRRYPTHKAGWSFFGDATSKNRHTSTTITDFYQIDNDKRFLNKTIKYPAKNPALQDRFAETNALLCNALGNRRCFVNPRCTNLRNDLQSRTYKAGTREPADEAGTDMGHITDALGYAIHALCPIRPTIDGVNRVNITGL